jgi:hypothetical protein
MIERAKARNRRHGSKTRFINASIESADLGDDKYTKVFAVHVAALHRPGRALEIVRARLEPDGRLYLFNQAPGWKAPRQAQAFAEQLAGSLTEAGYQVERTCATELLTGFAAGVVARDSSESSLSRIAPQAVRGPHPAPFRPCP